MFGHSKLKRPPESQLSLNWRVQRTPPPIQGLFLNHNPNTIKSYKISQKPSPKHATRGVAQSPYPIYRHGKACLSKQPPWCAAGDPGLVRGRSRVRAPGLAGALRAHFFLHPPFLPPSGDFFFCTFPTKPPKVLGLSYTTGWVYYNLFSFFRACHLSSKPCLPDRQCSAAV